MRRILAGAAIVSLALGCASYEPLPLDPEAERAALASRTLEGLVVVRSQPGQGDPKTQAPFDLSDGLDDAELVAVALTLNPDLVAKRLESGEAQALLVTAGLWPNPVLSAAWRPGLSGATGVTGEADLMVELLQFWERPAKQDAAAARIRETAAELVAEEWKVVADARRQHLAVLAHEQSVGLLDEEVGLREKIVDLVQRRRAAGDGTALDVSAAELDLAELRRDRRRAQAEFDAARRELNRLLGLPPAYTLRLTGSGKPITITVFDDFADDDLERRFMSGRFELRAKEAAYDRAEHELRLAVIGQYPRFSLGPSVSREPERTNYLGLGVMLELPLFNRNQGEIAAKESQRLRMRAEYSALLHRIRAGAYDARERARQARREVDAEEKEIQPLVRRSQETYDAAFKSKELSVVDWVGAQRRVLAARRSYLDALISYRGAAIQLESAVGLSLSTPLKKKE